MRPGDTRLRAQCINALTFGANLCNRSFPFLLFTFSLFYFLLSTFYLFKCSILFSEMKT